MSKRGWEIKSVVPENLFGKFVEIGAFSVWSGNLVKQEGTFIYLEDAYLQEASSWAEPDKIVAKKVGNIWIELNTVEYIMELGEVSKK